MTESQNDGQAENSIPPKTTFCGGYKISPIHNLFFFGDVMYSQVVSGLVGNPEDRSSRDEPTIIICCGLQINEQLFKTRSFNVNMFIKSKIHYQIHYIFLLIFCNAVIFTFEIFNVLVNFEQPNPGC